MESKIAIALCCLFLCGCTSSQTYQSRPSNLYVDDMGGREYYSYEIQIISDPPGAKIEWNNEYLGETPIEVKYDGHFGLLATAVVKAYPALSGQYVQTKVLHGRNTLPRTIYFDMSLKPAPLELDVK